MNTQAQVGYIGSVILQPETGSGANQSQTIMIRVTNADIRTSQEITYPDVVDGRVDNTLYQMGPKITGGTLAFPLVHEGSVLGNSGNCASTSQTLAATLWSFAAQRNGVGRLQNSLSAHVRYADNTAFTYPGCYVNTMTWNIVQSEMVNVSAELFGGANPLLPDPNRTNYQLTGEPPIFLAPARVVTWNDAQVEVYNDSGVDVLSGQSLRELTVTLNNGLERVFTLNGKLANQDIVPKKREISGTLKCLGREILLATQAYNNDQNFTSQSAIAFGYSLGNSHNVYWATGLYGVIFQIEEMAVTTGVFETTHNWRALGDCQRDFLATTLGTAAGVNLATPLPYPSTFSAGASNQYGLDSGAGGDFGTFPFLTDTGGG